jgi:Ni/Co efflux regulator RcnB
LYAEVSETEISSQEEDDMQHGYRYLVSSFFLTATLAAPMAMSAAAKPQDNGRQEERHRDDRDHNRFYDRAHNDYHNWDDNESRFYRQYLNEKRKPYRDFAAVKEKEQRAYWNWRHNHPDHDHDRGGR